MTLKALVVGDLHGEKPNIYFQGFDIIIAPGDFCSSDETRSLMFKAMRENAENPNSKVEWYDYVGKREARKIVKRALGRGREILEFLDSFGVPVYIVPGNNDWVVDKSVDWKFLRQDHYKGLVKGLKNIVDVHHRIVDVNGYQIIGYGIASSPEYPQYKEDIERLKAGALRKRKRKYERELKIMRKVFGKAKKQVILI